MQLTQFPYYHIAWVQLFSEPPSTAVRYQEGSPRLGWRIWEWVAAPLPNARWTTGPCNLGNSGLGRRRTLLRSSVTWRKFRAGALLNSKSLEHKEEGSQQTKKQVGVSVQPAAPLQIPVAQPRLDFLEAGFNFITIWGGGC